jgi:dienelactone hydrolase
MDHPTTAEAALAARFARLGRRMGLRDTAPTGIAAWQSATREHLRRIIGLDTHVACSPEPQIGAAVLYAGYRRERLAILVEPAMRMPCYVLVPAGDPPAAGWPVVIAPHGHGGGGKATVAGLCDTPARAQAIERYRYDYGVALARAGYLTICPDARGFGERRERTTAQADELAGSCRELNNMALPLGQTVTGMWVHDLMQLVSYISTRDDCDAQRIACAGLSGGGLQTLWLAALDLRVRAAVVSGYFYGYRESLLHLNQNCSCNYVPGLWNAIDMGDLGALVAPRPLRIESGSRDPLNGATGLTNVVGQLAIAQQAFDGLAAATALDHVVFDGEHRWDGTGLGAWLAAALA